ncbi:hypothetical protein BOTBODRAFT_27972 [Botryobasidium botryosum FD-172 SS1]|uniref:Uncharacterized protein n=1 Tax=Botryobasidium botryosum (strain FD-172 SS1) TaxID=930990 RepID=A0A067MUW9_BOTB1|nr:hypothetical protein BOTBODRAFT_27972 [Botryobasidium botryosum FD-172 SS1]
MSGPANISIALDSKYLEAPLSRPPHTASKNSPLTLLPMPSLSSTSSITSLLSGSRKGHKDHLSAFGALQSTFGFGGGAPRVSSPATSKPKQRSKKSEESRSSESHSSKRPLPASSSPKDYSAAFGSLQSSFGFAGGAPVVPDLRPTRKSR